MYDELKIVDFEQFCGTCKHKDENPDVEGSPCDICLSIPARESSHKPEKYEFQPDTKAAETKLKAKIAKLKAGAK